MTESGKNSVAEEAGAYLRTDHLADDLAGRSVRGGALTVAAQGGYFVIQLAGTVVLARLLRPGDFGLVAMVTAITGFVMLFKDLGLAVATVQKKDITHEQVSMLFWVNVAASVAAMAVTAAMAPAVAWFYGEPQLAWVTVALAGTFVFGGLGVQHYALLRRQMRFGTLATVHVCSAAVGVAAGVVSAWMGAGYWALVVMQAATVVAGSAGVWLASGWRPGRPARGAGGRSLLAFGGHLAGFNILNYIGRNLDNVLIGWYWGASPLGFYSKAYNMLTLPLRQISTPVGLVAVPALSRLQNDPARLRSYYLKTLALVTFCTTPLSVVCLLFAEEIITVFLGSQWLAATGIFRLLAIGAIAQPISFTTGWLFMAVGRTREMLQWGAVGVSIIVASFIIGLPYGPKGVALCYSCAVLIWVVPGMYFAVRGTGISLMDAFGAAAPPVVATAIAAPAALAIKWWLGPEMPLWATLGLGAAAMAVVYLAAVLYLFGKKEFYLSVWRSLME